MSSETPYNNYIFMESACVLILSVWAPVQKRILCGQYMA